MPIYEYSCLKCGDRTEALQGIHDAPLTTCEDCGGELKKLLSAPAFQFKGSGWYVTDYAKKGDKSNASSSESGSDSKSDDSSKSSTSSASSDDGKATSSTKSDSSGGASSTVKKESSA